MQERPSPSPRHAIAGTDDRFGCALIDLTAALAAYARRLTAGGADADDLLQDTMLRCWAARASFQAETNMMAWRRTVMKNSFLAGRRRARFQADLSDDALDRLLGVASGQEAAMEFVDVGWAMGELSQEHRQAVELASNGLSVEEASARLCIPPNTYKSRVKRGRHRLRELTENRSAYRPKQMRAKAERPMRPRRGLDWKHVVIG